MKPVAVNAASLERAAAAVREGNLVVMPTETVYGLAADATNPAAVARIYAAKGRPRFNPLISHILDLIQAERHAHLHPIARSLAERFWPGALTLVAPRRADSDIAELACAGLPSVALRAPAHPVARALIGAAGVPLAAPSANRSGRLSPTHASHAAEDLGEEVSVILDAGSCSLGLESTVVSVSADGVVTMLRPGAIARADIESVAGTVFDAGASNAPTSPGMMESHYAPRARLRLNATNAEAGENYLAFGAAGPPGALNLSPQRDLIEAAANLFAFLRQLDATGAEVIAVATIPREGLGEAINDRLARAAAGR